MITMLSSNQYQKLRSIFRSMDHDLVIDSILASKTPARVYVDNQDSPTAAATWFNSRIIIAGNPSVVVFNHDLNTLFADEVIPQAIKAGFDGFALYYSPDQWANQIGVLFTDRILVRGLRYYLVCKKLQLDWRASLPAGFDLLPVDFNLMARNDLKNMDDLRLEMQSERSSVEDFLEHSFGFCLVHDHSLVSWCLSEYNCGERCEVGVATQNKFRRLGLATIVTSALVEHALTHGIRQIGWHSWANNPGSIALARRVGFVLEKEYPAYFCLYEKIVEKSIEEG